MRRVASLALILALAVFPATAEDESSLSMGQAAPDGRGISATTIGADGHLVVTYTDGSKVDVGQVVGPQGSPGDAGPAGPLAMLAQQVLEAQTAPWTCRPGWACWP